MVVWVRKVVGHREGSVRGEAKTYSGGEGVGLGGRVRGFGGRGKSDSRHLTKVVADKASSCISPFGFSEVFHKYRKAHKLDIPLYPALSQEIEPCLHPEVFLPVPLQSGLFTIPTSASIDLPVV